MFSQQDSAAANTANSSMDALCNTSGDHIISHPVSPIHPPNAVPCNDYVWRSLEDNTFTTISTQKANLTNHHACIIGNFWTRNCEQYLLSVHQGVKQV